MSEENKKPIEEQKSDAPVEEKKEETANTAPADAGSDKPVEVPAKFKSLVEQIEQLKVMDLAELVKILEEKFGVSASAPMAAMAVTPGANGDAAEEKTSFDIELTAAGENKIGAIKAVRAVTELGLKEAKDLVDGAPQIVRENIKKEEAEEIKKKLEEAGATVTLK